MLLSLFLGIVIGAVMGLTGAGGGILAVPALVAAMGWSMQQAAPVALIAVGASAALGALEGFRHGLVRYRAAMLMALVGFPFAALGSMLAHGLSQPLLMGMFSLVLLVAAYRMALRGSGRTEHETDPHRKAGQLDPETGRFQWNAPTFLLVCSIGALTGLMSGLLGVGGGFIIVPMLRRYTNLTMHGIVATSLLLIALVSCSAVLLSLARREPAIGVLPVFRACHGYWYGSWPCIGAPFARTQGATRICLSINMRRLGLGGEGNEWHCIIESLFEFMAGLGSLFLE